ncbi:subtilisin-like protease SBT3.5 [Tanacetum coccineum]
MSLTRDRNGHGTHTASMAAGWYMMDMSYKELASGGAGGSAPIARVAMVFTVSLCLGPDAPQGDYFINAISLVMKGHKGHPLFLLHGSLRLQLHPLTEFIGVTSLPINPGEATGTSVDRNKVNSYHSPESRVAKSQTGKAVGGVGMILVDEDVGVAILCVIPAEKSGKRDYPALTTHDVAAPGLEILAAWSPAIGPKIKYNVMSGTSMACPHVTDILALIKAVHPSSSPSAIKSVIMTTASVFDKGGTPMRVNPDRRRGIPFDYGSGVVDPKTILDPGLAYDATPTDYQAFLCLIGYDEKSLRLITRDKITCESQAFSTSQRHPPLIILSLLYQVSSQTSWS